jgi:hypothetical protein
MERLVRPRQWPSSRRLSTSRCAAGTRRWALRSVTAGESPETATEYACRPRSPRAARTLTCTPQWDSIYNAIRTNEQLAQYASPGSWNE